MKVSEPAAIYNASHLQSMKDRLINLINGIDDERKLQRCLELLGARPMPCRFTEDELDVVIESAEREGFASQEEVDNMFAKWRH